jgi:tetratricopeptide (TPR) repeat protein
MVPRALSFILVLFLAAGCSTEAPPEQKLADAAYAAARAAIARGDGPEGKRQLAQMIALDTRLGRTARVAEAQAMLAELQTTVADFDSALATFAEAAKSYRSIAERPSVRDITRSIAAIYRQMGRDRKAQETLSELLRLTRVFGDSAGVRAIEWDMLPLCRDLDLRDEERKILDELALYYSSSGDVSGRAQVQLALGLSLLDHNTHDLGAAHFAGAYSMAMQSRDTALAVAAMGWEARSLEKSGKPNDALSAYAQALKLADLARGLQRQRLELLIRVGNLYLRSRQIPQAQRFYRAALSAAIALEHRIAEGYLTVQLGACDLDTALPEAVKKFQSARELFVSLGYSRGIAYALTMMGKAFQRNGQLPDAVQLYTAAVTASEQWVSWHEGDSPLIDGESAAGASGITAPYNGLLDVLLQTGKYEQAFWYAERRLQREMFDVLSVSGPVTADGAVNRLIESWQDTRGHVVGAQRQLVLLASGRSVGHPSTEVAQVIARESTVLEEQVTALVQAAPPLAPCFRVGTVGAVEVQKALPPATVALIPVTTPRSVYVFAVTSGGLDVQISAVPQDQIAAARREYLGFLQTRTALTDSEQLQPRQADLRTLELARALYEALLRPVERDLAGVKKLLVVLPGDLASIPVHALRKSALPADPYLAERYAVSYAPSASSLLLPQSAPGKVTEVVGLGCAGATSWDVEYELRDIRSFYKDVRLYFGKEATLEALRGEHASVLHVAAELVMDDRRPGNAHILVSDGKSAATFAPTPLGELLQLKPFGVVAISNLADEHTQILPAEPYVFLAGGNSTVVANSYVPTRGAKKMFWAGFYSALLSGVDADAAYRKALLEMIKDPKYAAPHLWAPFFLWSR